MKTTFYFEMVYLHLRCLIYTRTILTFFTATCDASWIFGDNLRIQYSSKQHPSTLGWDESINFSCDEGYRLRGASSLKCLGSMGSVERNGMMAYCESE